ncbi:pyridoxamine 5'-phosphate oxidase, partial [Tremellales sp. Uapishka_1]
MSSAVNHISGTSSSKIALTTHNQYHSPRLVPPLPASPIALFKTWFSEALTPPPDSEIPAVKEPEAMTISTSTAAGIPSSRMVLLKTVDDRGFIFFTNYESRKSQELKQNPYAALTFYWREVSRSVRVVGRVEKVERAESEEYFGTRPKGSQIGAWASEQSTVVGEETLQNRVDELSEKFKDGNVECPEHWGGWRIVPFEVEFWCGQPSRLHDRFRYTAPQDQGEGGVWEVNRLAP